MRLRTLLVDDEPMAIKGLAEDLSHIDFIEVVATAENAAIARQMLDRDRPHLMFLDLQMPKLTGFQFLQSLLNPPMVIAVTAYPQYALEGYKLDLLDYLLKPVSFESLLRACTKALEYYKLTQGNIEHSPGQPEYVFIKVDNRYEKILFADILFVEAADNYVFIHTNSKKYITYITFKRIEDELPNDQFIRVHKSFIVAADRITSVEGNIIRMGEKQIPVSRALKEDVMNRIVNKSLLKR